MRKFYLKVSLVFIGLMMLGATLTFAGEKIVTVMPDGVIRLESGEKVQLAGIEMPEEAIVLLSVLLVGKDCVIKVAKEISVEESADTIPKVYMYVETNDLLIEKAVANKNTRADKMVNEFMLSIGSAKTDTRIPFKYQDTFLQIEETARAEGQGIWSYESVTEKVLKRNSTLEL